MSSEKKKKAIIILAVLLSVSFVINFTLLILVIINHFDISEYRSDINNKGQVISQQLEKAAELQRDIEGLEKEISDCNAEINELKKSDEEKAAEWIKKVEGLESELADKKEQSEQLQAKISELETVYSIDINRQIVVLSELEQLLENPPKKYTEVEVPTGEYDIYGNPVMKKELQESDAAVALYYADIKNGYNYSYNADSVFYSASLIKMPYALSLLKASSDEMNSHADDPLYVPLGLDDIFTYTSNKKQEGTGIIKDSPDGTQYTYLQLVDYLIKDSDNVAFKALQNKYGYGYMNMYIANRKLTSMSRNAWNITAKDASTILADTYDFITADQNYGSFLESSMKRAGQKNMIAAGVGTKTVAHKYGWDKNSYHDMALVYGEKPYSLVILTDLHQGGKEVDTYIQSIAKKINELHDNFYRSK